MLLRLSFAHLVIKAHSVEYLPQVVSWCTWASIYHIQDKVEMRNCRIRLVELWRTKSVGQLASASNREDSHLASNLGSTNLWVCP